MLAVLDDPELPHPGTCLSPSVVSQSIYVKVKNAPAETLVVAEYLLHHLFYHLDVVPRAVMVGGQEGLVEPLWAATEHGAVTSGIDHSYGQRPWWPQAWMALCDDTRLLGIILQVVGQLPYNMLPQCIHPGPNILVYLIFHVSFGFNSLVPSWEKNIIIFWNCNSFINGVSINYVELYLSMTCFSFIHVLFGIF